MKISYLMLVHCIRVRGQPATVTRDSRVTTTIADQQPRAGMLPLLAMTGTDYVWVSGNWIVGRPWWVRLQLPRCRLQAIGSSSRPIVVRAQNLGEYTAARTIVASDSMMNFGVSIFSFPQVIFSLGTAPEYDPKLVVESLI